MSKPIGDLYITSNVEMDLDPPDGVACFNSLHIAKDCKLTLHGDIHSVQVDGDMILDANAALRLAGPRSAVELLGKLSG